MNESTSVMGPPAVGNKDNLNAMGDAEDPCCGPGTTASASTSSSPSWRRRCKVKKLRGRLCRMQAFGIVFTLAGALAYTSQVRVQWLKWKRVLIGSKGE